MEIETNWSTGVPKHDDRHLTTTQLSALIDKQLSAQELALCKAHLQTCQQCQSALVGLQQTVALLQALPEPALPRSFALPAGVTYLQERPARHSQDQGEQPATTNPPVRRRSWPQRSLRAVSTIAAVIGLAFLLSGILPTLPHSSGASSTTSAPSTSSQGVRSAAQPAITSTPSAATATAEKAVSSDQHGTGVRTPTPGNTTAALTPTPIKGSSHQNPSTNTQAQPPLPLPDLTTPLGRQETGFTLLVLGIVGVLLTRRKRA